MEDHNLVLVEGAGVLHLVEASVGEELALHLGVAEGAEVLMRHFGVWAEQGEVLEDCPEGAAK